MRALALLLVIGCASEPMETPDAGTPDSGVKTIVFEAEATTGPSLAFGGATLTEQALEVDLVAHGLLRVYGLAYRIEFDPAVLAFEGLERQPAFTHEDLFEVKEARPGLIVVAESAVARRAGIDLDGAAIARARFTRSTPALTTLRIRRPFGLDDAGNELRLAAGGGGIVER